MRQVNLYEKKYQKINKVLKTWRLEVYIWELNWDGGHRRIKWKFYI